MTAVNVPNYSQRIQHCEAKNTQLSPTKTFSVTTKRFSSSQKLATSFACVRPVIAILAFGVDPENLCYFVKMYVSWLSTMTSLTSSPLHLKTFRRSLHRSSLHGLPTHLHNTREQAEQAPSHLCHCRHVGLERLLHWHQPFPTLMVDAYPSAFCPWCHRLIVTLQHYETC